MRSPSERTLKDEPSKAYAIVYNAVADKIEAKSIVVSGL
jgi:hypothetical protein